MTTRTNILDTVSLQSGELAWPVAQQNGIAEPTFRMRLHKGWSPDEAATLPVKKRDPENAARNKAWRAEYREKYLQSLAQMDSGEPAWPVAQANEISQEVFRQRLAKGMSGEKAATLPFVARRRRPDPSAGGWLK